jgi:hypothetical protein
MAYACSHQFQMIKSDTNLLQWTCQQCYSGPHWMIWECMYCKLYLCLPCTQASCTHLQLPRNLSKRPSSETLDRPYKTARLEDDHPQTTTANAPINWSCSIPGQEIKANYVQRKVRQRLRIVGVTWCCSCEKDTGLTDSYTCGECKHNSKNCIYCVERRTQDTKKGK